MGPIQDRTREHLGTSDKQIAPIAGSACRPSRRCAPARPAADGAVTEQASAITGPDTIDCIAPPTAGEAFWTEAAAAKRAIAE
ncbi:MAG: hypothetical protein IPP44_30750 [Ideonella sp.]|nr:hypothetical protein [Ideonella sp.]